MNMEEFLRRILPPDGVVLIAVPVAKGFRHKGFDSVEEAAAFAQQCDEAGHTVYHACATYKAKPYRTPDGRQVARKSENWLAAKAFWCDIDCGPTKAQEGKGYATQKEGAVALLTWCSKVGLPFPMLVNSGRGIHAYWCLTEALSSKDWAPVATALKGLMQVAGLIVDPSRTADFASVLRPIGTHNRKDPSNPLEVKLVRDAEPVDTMTFIAKITELVANSDEPIPTAPPAWMTGGDSIAVSYPKVDASANAIADKCHQVAVMRDTQGDVNYEHWRGVIGLISHCTEGIELAKAWSARRGETGHANVDVETRYETWDSGPTTCAFFEGCNPDGCADCPFKGKVKSPISLGKVEPEPKAEEVTAVIEGDEHSTSMAIVIPPMPQGYVWDGGCMVRLVPDKDGVLQAHSFCRTRFYLVERIRNAEGRFEFTARAHMAKGIIREFQIPGSLAGAGGSKLLELLGSYEIMATTAKDSIVNMQAYIKDSIFKLTEERDVTHTFTHFGWQQDGSFLMGRRLYRKDGSVLEALLSGNAAEQANVFPAPKGTVEGYADAINWVYNRKGMEPMQYLICSLWAAPMVELCEPTYNGIPCAVTGPSSGKGKTTAAWFALYAYGSAFPSLTFSGKEGATAKSQAAFVGTLHSLPVLFDEVTNKDSRQLSDICYALSNGVENMRLRSANGSVKFGDRQTWRTQVAMTGNSDIGARLASAGNTEAEAMRVFEIPIDSYDIPVLDPIAVSTMLSSIERHQGSAGEAFVKYLVTHRDEAEKILADTYSWITEDKHLATQPKYRFYRNHMACTLATARIMKSLGVMDFDLDALRAFAIDAVSKIFQAVRMNNSADPMDWFSAMISDMSPMIVTTPTYAVKPNEAPYVTSAPRGLMGRIIRGTAHIKDPEYDMRMFLSAKAVKEWCSEHRVWFDAMAKTLVSKGILIERMARMTLGKGTTIASIQQRCWVLDLSKIEEDINVENGD